MGFVGVTVKVTIGHKCIGEGGKGNKQEQKALLLMIKKKKKSSLNSLIELLLESLLCD